MKLSKTQLRKIEKIRRILSRLLGPLLKTGLPLMKNVLKLLAKSVLIPLGSTAAAAAAATDAEKIRKKMFRSGLPLDLAYGMNTMIISNEKMNDIMRIDKWFEESSLLINKRC